MSDLEIAKQLERSILGPDWHSMPCGCVLHIECKMASKKEYVRLHKVEEHRLCNNHLDKPSREKWGIDGSLRTFQGWYELDVDGPKPITRQQFQSNFEWYVTYRIYEGGLPSAYTHGFPDDYVILAADRLTKIRWSGAVLHV